VIVIANCSERSFFGFFQLNVNNVVSSCFALLCFSSSASRRSCRHAVMPYSIITVRTVIMRAVFILRPKHDRFFLGTYGVVPGTVRYLVQ
jgi:hypothetical protein